MSPEKARQIICEQKISAISQDVQNLKLLRNEKELRLITPLSPKQKTFRELAAGLHEIFAPSDVTKRKTLRDEYYGRLDAMENEYEKKLKEDVSSFIALSI